MSAPQIGVVNLNIQNLRSLTNAVDSLGYDFTLLDDPSGLDALSHVIIPGVGSFATAAQRLADRGWPAELRNFSRAGKPLAGICLGMHLLGIGGDEGGRSEGLGLIDGWVEKLDANQVPAIPHVGWNSVEFTRTHPALSGVASGVDFYFVHSFHLRTAHEQDVLGSTNCGQRFASIVANGNVVGFQFHPEKSQVNGLRILDNFCAWDGMC